MARAILQRDNLVTPPMNFHTFPNTGSLNLSAVGSGGSAVASSDFTRAANQTLKCTTGAGMNLEVRKTAAYTMNNRRMGIWVYVPDYTLWSSFLLYVGSANFAAFSNFTYSFGAADKQYNGWHYIDTQADGWAGGTPTDFTITQQDWKIRCIPQPSKVAVCYFDLVECAYWHRAKLLLTYDDENAGAWTDTFGIQYANTLGLKANLAIIASQVGTNVQWMTTAQVEAAYAAGNDLIVHGLHGSNGVLSNGESQVLIDVLANRDYLDSNDWTRGSRFYVYPNGTYQGYAGDLSVLNPIKTAGMLAARGTVSPVTMQPKIGSANLYYLTHIGMQAADAPATVISRIDSLIQRGQIAFLMFHDIVAAGATTTQVNSADHKTVVDAIASRMRQGLIDVPTFSQWYTSLIGGRALG
ncbi:MAG: hypothetical protein HYX63_01550 [Gammaproteobacteria bacterium]|nr:hypothetical protein [Gammaproteobacteria bacterium]